MAEFNIRSDAVDVEQIMEQIRARVREKRGVDYTEEQIRELANVKLDRFLDPKNVRSDLLEHFRKQNDRSSEAAASATEAALEAIRVPAFEPDDVYRSSRGGIGRILHAIRRLLRPILKLFINPGPMLESVRALSTHVNSTTRALALNEARNRRRAELDVLTYEVLNNLVVEMTRLAIDMKNHRMRVESVAARLDFDERRARALEQIVQFRTPSTSGGNAPAADAAAPPGDAGGENGGTEKRRRRRRRGRRRSAGGTPSTASVPADTDTTTGGPEPADTAGTSGAGDEPAANAEPRSDTAREPADTSEP